MAGPLEGARVLDFTHVLAGPFCTALLADMGADVIKVESPLGDQVRNWSGPDDVPIAFHNLNRRKRSIVLDLHQERGREIAGRLAEAVDIVVENFRPGAMDRLDLGYETLAERNPALVYGSITGFGDAGPYRDRGGYDLIVQGMAGIMSVTGQPGALPTKAGVPVADLSAGLYALAGIAAAYGQARATGRGTHVNVSLLEAAISLTVWESAQYWMTGADPQPLGSAHRFAAPYQVFEAADGYLTIAANTDAQFARLVAVVDAGDLAKDPRYVTNMDRVAHRAELAEALAPRIKPWARDELIASLIQCGVPSGPIYTMSEVYADPHVRERQVCAETTDESGRPIPILRSPIRTDASTVSARAPRLGEHTDQILSERLGLSDRAIDELRAAGITR